MKIESSGSGGVYSITNNSEFEAEVRVTRGPQKALFSALGPERSVPTLRANIAAMKLANPMVRFLIFWGVNTLSLWVADDLFDGMTLQTSQALFIAGLLLGIVNTFLKPLLIVLTLPLSVVTLGLFVLVINALMLLLVAGLVPGFYIAGFWSGFFVALFVSVFSFILNSLIGYNKVTVRRID